MDVLLTSMNNQLGNQQLSVFNYADYKDPVRINPNVDVQIRHRINEETFLQWGVGYRERLPSTAEQFGFYLYNAYDGFDYIGIPDISDEKSITGSVSMNWKGNKIEGGLDLSGYWFRDFIFGRIDPGMTAMTIGANGVKFYENLPSAMILAVDSRLVYSPGKISIPFCL
jgi:iron complex outermembrane receptor protein